ncbi:MAG TPA: hypothetical protein VF427_07500 [Noviherbaspirillum sp.]
MRVAEYCTVANGLFGERSIRRLVFSAGAAGSARLNEMGTGESAIGGYPLGRAMDGKSLKGKAIVSPNAILAALD